MCNQFNLTIEKIICTKRIRNGAPTNISAMIERSFESFLLNNPIMPSNTASGANTQATPSVMLFKELKVSGEMFNCDTAKLAPRDSTDRNAVSRDQMPK